MKRVYIAVALLAISVSLCIFEQYTVTTAYEQSTAYIEKAIEYADKKDYKQAEKTCSQLTAYWSEKYPSLTAMIDHGPLDDAGVTINSLEELAKDESDDLKETLITAKNQIESIYENQKVSLGNIF